MANETEGAPCKQEFLKPVVSGYLDPGSDPHLLGLLEPPYPDPTRLKEKQMLFR